MPKYIGYHEQENLPFKPGDVVIIPKGTKIQSFHPTRKHYTAGRTYRVKVDHLLPGSDAYRSNRWGDLVPAANPEIRWPGTGGYWCAVDINDVLAANGKE